MQSTFNRSELVKLKDYAKYLYTKENLTQDDISKKTGVHINTIKRWSAAGNWKKLQQTYAFSRDEQVAFMMDELGELNRSIRIKAKGKRFADAKEGDVRFKLVRHIKELQADGSLVEVVNTSSKLLDFIIKEEDIPKAQEMGDLMDRYIKSML